MCKEYEQLTADQNPWVMRSPGLKHQVVDLKVGDAVIRAPTSGRSGLIR
jgi:hypothetical protein